VGLRLGGVSNLPGPRAGRREADLLILQLDRSVMSGPGEVELPTSWLRHVNDRRYVAAGKKCSTLADQRCVSADQVRGDVQRARPGRKADQPEDLVVGILWMTSPERVSKDDRGSHGW